MKITVVILLLFLSLSAYAFMDKFDQEPNYETLGNFELNNDPLVMSIKADIAKRYSYDVLDILFSPPASELVKLNNKTYKRLLFQVTLKDQLGYHGYDTHMFMVWIDDQNHIYKIFDVGIYSPV